MTLQSAFAAGAKEIILVDDGSKDRLATSRYLNRYDGLIVVRTMPRGISHALNTGFAHSRSPFVCRLDCGDTMHPDKLKIQFDKTEAASFTHYHDPVSGKDRSPPADWQSKIYGDNQFCGSTTMVTRNAWERVGGYDESLQYCVDWDFAMKVQHLCGWTEVPQVLGACAEYHGGHSDRAKHDGELRAIRDRDRATVHKRGRKLKGK